MSTATDVLVREVHIQARPETVFPFFTDAEKMARWFGSMVTLDAKPQGALRVVIGDRNVASGRYVEISPHTRVVFTFGWEAEDSLVRPGASTVEVTLAPKDGGTLVRLAHRDLPSDESRASHNEGWTHYMERLAIAAAGGDPGNDPWSCPDH